MRVRLTDGSGRYFESDAATKYDEDSFHDGQNRISRATGGQWEHEALYRTAGGAWVLNHWSQWQGSHESYTMIDAERAYRWLSVNGYDEAIPPEALASMAV